MSTTPLAPLRLTHAQFSALPEDQRIFRPAVWPYGPVRRVLWNGVEREYQLFDSEAHFPAHLSELALPFSADVAYAYSPRENTGSRGGYHIVVQEAFKVGRIARQQGETLCKKKFWGLDGGRDGHEVSCRRCLELARRLSVSESTDDAEAEFKQELASPVCGCGQPKHGGEAMCAACAQVEEQEAGRDHEEEAQQEQLLRALPDGHYTASELREHLL